MIETRKLVRKYGELLAVDGVSFSINKGEVVGLLGHNGAGKTTVMKMITGVLEPTSGEVLVDGQPLEKCRLDAQRRLGYLPENCPIYPEMTVIEYLAYVADLRGVAPTDRSRALRDALEKTKLSDRANQLIGTLSKGYRQRVGVAQAIVHKPEILILDEPTSGLDPAQITEIRTLITDLGKESTVILSTHILQEVQAVCSRVLIMVGGKLGLDSTLADLWQSNRLRVGVNEYSAELETVIKAVKGVGNIARVSGNRGFPEYVVTLTGSEEKGSPGSGAVSTEDISAQIAQSVVQRGSRLFSMQLETKELESVFREVNSGA